MTPHKEENEGMKPSKKCSFRLLKIQISENNLCAIFSEAGINQISAEWSLNL